MQESLGQGNDYPISAGLRYAGPNNYYTTTELNPRTRCIIRLLHLSFLTR